MVKKEAQLDRFDKVFGAHFQGIEMIADDLLHTTIPKDWLDNMLSKFMTDEEKEQLEKLGGLDALMERFKELMEEQQKRHQGGSKWIGTGGTSPFGAGGYNPEGFRMGPESAGNRTAIKVWQKENLKTWMEMWS